MATDLPEKPLNREEAYLADIAGQEVVLPEKPESRKEQYLAYIAENGGGGGGGTNNFNQLTNRPKYNGTTMTGETNIPEVKAYSNFVGTDGTSAGTAGLVPAPATTDAGKFLKADGTWDTAGGGSVIPVQTTGTSTTDVMSQDATTKLVYPDITNKPLTVKLGAPSSIYTIANGVVALGSYAVGTTDYSVAVGNSALASGTTSPIAVGRNSKASGTSAISIGYGNTCSGANSVAIGDSTNISSASAVGIGSSISESGLSSVAIGNASGATGRGSIALGARAYTNTQGVMAIGTSSTAFGYNNTNYRLITGVHDGQSAHDAATYGQLNTRLDGLTLLKISQTDYDNLQSYDANTLYVITGA